MIEQTTLILEADVFSFEQEKLNGKITCIHETTKLKVFSSAYQLFAFWCSERETLHSSVTLHKNKLRAI